MTGSVHTGTVMRCVLLKGAGDSAITLLTSFYNKWKVNPYRMHSLVVSPPMRPRGGPRLATEVLFRLHTRDRAHSWSAGPPFRLQKTLHKQAGLQTNGVYK